MDTLTKGALDRIRRAVKDRDPEGYTGVRPADVIAVAVALPPGHGTGLTEALKNGAAGALSGRDDDEVWQKTEHLLHLLERAGE